VNFPCLKQPSEDNGMETWYAILQMMEYVKGAEHVLLPGLKNKFKNMVNTTDRVLRE
jgi:hypothetical protein